LGVVVLPSTPALTHAAAWDVQARTEAQAYTIAAWSPASGRALSRRRLVQDLDLAGFEVVTGEDAGLSLQLRVDADLAVNDAEVRGLDDGWRDRLELVSGRLHWNRLAGGRLDLELGRITAQDAVGLWRFDGGRATARPVPWLALSAFGGWRVTGTSWIGSADFAPDGRRESDRRRIAAGVPLCSLEPAAPTGCADATLDDPAPTFGARLAVGDPLAGRGMAEVLYRRTVRAGAVVEEKAGAGGRLRLGDVAADAAGEYDAWVGRLTDLRAGLRYAPAAWLSLAAEGSHLHPTFEAGSLWNLFETVPSREGRLRADLAPGAGAVRLWGAGGLKRYESSSWGREHLGDRGGWEPFGALGATAALGETRLAADGWMRAGDQGTQGFLTLLARHLFRSWVEVEGRATLARLVDRVAPKNGGVFPALAVLAAARLERLARVGLQVEDSAPRWERNDVRLFAFLSVGAGWDGRAGR
jgi:hypothetical protein